MIENDLIRANAAAAEVRSQNVFDIRILAPREFCVKTARVRVCACGSVPAHDESSESYC